MLIEKGMTNENNYRNSSFYYKNARMAMYSIVKTMFDERLINTILLPAYIGWSPREGSGLFDPINSIQGLNREYYRVNMDLEIDEEDLFSKNINRDKLVLIVNYFGFRNNNIKKLVEKIKEKSAWIIEDNAHALFTYTKYGTIGADACFFSLHKMLPLKDGGQLKIFNENLKNLHVNYSEECNYNNIYEYDFLSISNKRIENYLKLDSLIRNNDNFCSYFHPLKEQDKIKEAVPQTYPIVISRGDRDKIYNIMNKNGYGVVSLYHTLIPELRNDKEFIISQELSSHILNLPVHQDVNSDEYVNMLEMLLETCKITEEN